MPRARGHARSAGRPRPTSTSRPAPSRSAARRPSPESLNGPGASGSGRSIRPSSSALRPDAVIQSFSSGSAHTATAARPPGRRTRAISPAAPSMSGTSISPQRHSTPSTDASASVSDAASSTANETPSSPSSAARRRAASSISGATSVDRRCPPGRRRGSARKPVSPGPAASSRIVSPGFGSSSATSRSDTSCVADQISSRCRSQPAATERHASICSRGSMPRLR